MSKNNDQNVRNPRRFSFHALLFYEKEKRYLEEFFCQWKNSLSNDQDKRLAKEIAYGVVRRKKTLDYYLKQLNKRLRLSIEGKVILRMAVYQYFFMDKIPFYAIRSEAMKLAKSSCHPSVSAFIYATLMKMEKQTLVLPQENDLDDLSIRFSYTQYFIKSMLDNYGIEKTKKILDTQNQVSPVFFRIRDESVLDGLTDIELFYHAQFDVYKLFSDALMLNLINDKRVYIQNPTTVELIDQLTQHLEAFPKEVLDLCASPGGKLLLLYDLFPNSCFVANDLSEKKIDLINQNLIKYQVTAEITQCPAEHYPVEKKFDLIIADVPCSNSGVLNKRVEARWRLEDKAIKLHRQKQYTILSHAVKLLSSHGEIFYLTCSILPEENENVTDDICKNFDMTKKFEVTILPTADGRDGGYGCSLQKSH